jgi:hypothetical protein
MRVGDNYVYKYHYEKDNESKVRKYPVEIFSLSLVGDSSGTFVEAEIIRSDDFDIGFPEMTLKGDFYLLYRVTITDFHNLIPVKKRKKK